MEETRDVHVVHQGESKLIKTSFYLLVALAFLSFVAFIPGLAIDTNVSVSLIAVVLVSVVSVLYAIHTVRVGTIQIIRSPFFYALIITNVVFLLSALLSENVHNSLIGFGGESNTFGFFFISSLLLLLTALICNTKDRIFTAYIAFFCAFSLIGLHHLIRFIFGPDVLSFGVFPLTTSSMLGGWNSIAIFFGAGTIIALLTDSMLWLSRKIKYVVRSMFVVSLFFLVAVNFTPVWVIVGLFAGVLLIYEYVGRENTSEYVEADSSARKTRINYLAVITTIIALLFVIVGNGLYAYVGSILHTSVIDVRPSWTATTHITKETLRENFFLGSGPNTFGRAWVQYKPETVNDTIFYATDFTAGIGFIPTLIATTGILGFLSVCLMLCAIVYIGFRVFSQKIEDKFSLYLIISSFAVSLYLWCMLFVYTPSASMLLFSFFALGLFFAAATREDLIPVTNIHFARHPRTSFITVILIVFIVVVSISFAYGFAKSAISRVIYTQGIKAVEHGESVDVIQQKIVSAIMIEPHDIYYRALADIGLFRLATFLQTETTEQSQKDIEATFQEYLSGTISAAEEAIKLDQFDYVNWLKLADVYAFVAAPPLSLPGAYENATAALLQAKTLNPTNPEIPLIEAKLDFSVNKIESGRAFIQEALSKKENYFEAHFLLSQVEALTGNVDQAIVSAERSAVLAPNDAGVFFQLGLLYYNKNNYQGAIDAFGRAVLLVPDYSNAKYFLALALEKVGRRDEAIILFEQILEINPDSEEVKFILKNLREGKQPFAEAPDSINPEPERADELPLEE